MQEDMNPIVVDLGKRKRKRIKDLKKGQGSLLNEVYDVAKNVKDELGAEASGKLIVPIVVVHKRKNIRLFGVL
jgi:hypothetical protein